MKNNTSDLDKSPPDPSTPTVGGEEDVENPVTAEEAAMEDKPPLQNDAELVEAHPVPEQATTSTSGNRRRSRRPPRVRPTGVRQTSDRSFADNSRHSRRAY